MAARSAVLVIVRNPGPITGQSPDWYVQKTPTGSWRAQPSETRANLICDEDVQIEHRNDSGWYHGMTVLEYRDSKFHECKGEPTTPITLKVDESQKKLILTVPNGVSMIERRAAERNARAIQKTGFQTERRGSIGRGYELVIEGHGGSLPDRLTRSPREVY